MSKCFGKVLTEARGASHASVGKSHVGCGIGHALIDAGYRVLYMRTSELVQRLQAARQSLQLPQALAKLDRYDVRARRGPVHGRWLPRWPARPWS